MHKIRILQFGDIHYSWAESHKPAVDMGSKPAKLTGITNDLLATGLAINKLCGAIKPKLLGAKPDFFAFMGDYTVRANEAELEKSLSFCKDILKGFELSDEELADKVLLVPGNHDVVRPDAPGLDPLHKFIAYDTAAKRVGFKNTSTSKISVIRKDCADKAVKMIGLNTCVGCGEFRELPEVLRKRLIRMMQHYKTSTGKRVERKRFDLLTEQLDIPYIERKDIDGLDEELAATHDQRVVAVAGHHNLLPQRETRVLSYGELLNSGILRELLVSQKYPVVYLHCHIHSAPIEFIRDPQAPNGGVLSISAPLIQDGFNMIDLFLDDHHYLLGVEVTPWRFSNTMVLRDEATQRISLAYGKNRLSSLPDEARSIFAKIFELGKDTKSYPTVLATTLGISLEKVQELCEAMNWLNLIHINNRTMPVSQWDVSLEL